MTLWQREATSSATSPPEIGAKVIRENTAKLYGRPVPDALSAEDKPADTRAAWAGSGYTAGPEHGPLKRRGVRNSTRGGGTDARQD